MATTWHYATLERVDFVALVNNDVMVSDGWLEPLLDVLRSDETVGAAAPKLLFAESFSASSNCKPLGMSPAEAIAASSVSGGSVSPVQRRIGARPARGRISWTAANKRH